MDPMNGRNMITRTQAIFSPSPSPSLVMAWMSIHNQTTKAARPNPPQTRANSNPNNPPMMEANITSSLLLIFGPGFFHGLPSAGDLFVQLLELDAGEPYRNWRQSSDKLRHIPGKPAGTTADAVAGIDDDH